MSMEPVAQIGFGQVRHTRLRPRRHAFAYDTFFLMLPMRRLQDAQAMGALAINRAAPISFHDRDHGDGRGPEQGGALAWLEGCCSAKASTTRGATSGCTPTRACWATPSNR